MKKSLRVLFLLTSFIYFTKMSGQVGIGTELPDASSQLEVVAEDRGILIPRVALESSTDQITISNGNVNSLLVFNTESQSDITPGYYYWYIDRWRRIGDSSESFKETLTTLIDKGEGVFVYTDEEGGESEINVPAAVINDIINQGAIYEEVLNLIKSNETVTTLVDNGDGTITYYNEDDVDENGNIIGNGATVDVAGIIANNITNQGDVYDAIVNILDADSDELIDNGDGTFTHTAADGTVVDFDANTTQFVNNGDGTYTFINKNGDSLTVDAVGDVVQNIRNKGDIYNEIVQIVEDSVDETITDLVYDEDENVLTYTDENGDSHTIELNNTNLYYDSINQTLVYTNSKGETQEIDLASLVAANETVTTIVNNNDGTYTYINEENVAFIIDVPASVVENFETIVNDGPVTINGDTFNTVEEYLTHIANESVAIEGSEFITVAGSGTDSDPYIVSIEEGAENTMLITNEDGDLEWATIEDIVQANETITDIIDNGDGTYTYNNEAGDTFIIDIPASVVENFETIVNDGPVTINGDTFNTVEEYLTHIANESVAIEGSEFISVAGSGTDSDPYIVSIEEGAENTMLITNEDGDLEWATIEDIVQANETLTVLSDNGNGSFTYTDENGDDITFDATRAAIIDNGDGSYTIKDADGNDIIIDIPGDIINNFESIVHGDEVIVDGITYTNIEEYFTILAENNETVTELIYDAAENTLAYTDEEGNVQTIQLNITDLSYDADDNKLVYTNSKGEEQEIDLASLVAANETITDIADNGDGTYTYTNEEGNTFIIDVPASVVENFETIVNDGPVTINGDTFNTVEEYLTHIANESVEIEGSEFITVAGSGTDSDPYIVSIEGGSENTMLITDDNGNVVWATIEDIVQANETITDITDNGDGTYTYNNEAGNTFIIDVPASVVENFETIVNDGPVTINGDTFNTVEEYLTHIANESIAIEGSEFISVAGSGTDSDPYVVSIEEGAENTMLITNEYGDLEWATIEDIVQANETITDIIDNGDGTYTYNNEAGDAFIIDIPASVVENFETIVNDGPVTINGDTFNTVEEYLTHLANESVTIEGSEFITVSGSGTDSDPYIVSIEEGAENTMLVTNEDGDLEWATIEDIVQANETITDILDNGDGTYTYNNEAGDAFIIDVPASVVENFETIVNDGPVTINGDTFNTVEEYLTHIANESVAIEGSEFITVAGSGTEGDPYVVSIEGGSENTMLITNEDGDLEWATIEDIVQANETITDITDNGDGTYTYTNEEGNTFIIDVPASVIENFETIVNDGPVTINGDTFNTVEEYLTHIANESIAIEGSEFISVTGSGTDTDPYVVSIEEGAENTMLITNEDGDLEWATIEDIVQANETITDILDNGDGTYTYTNEEGNAFIIDVPASVVENFETIVNDGPVTINGDTFNTVEEYLTHIANESVAIEGSEFISVAGSGTDSDPYIVSIEEGAENTMLITNEDGDLEWATIEDIVQANETITDILDNGDGTYTYTNEEGNTFIIDVPASVVENFETIVNDGPVTINGDTFNTVEEYLTHLANESVTIEGSEFISVAGSGTDTDPYVVSIEEGAENTMLITNEYGDLEWATIEDIVQANETITDITDNGDGTYTYNNEAGDAFIIDVPASVVENFETIVNDGPVTINGDTFNTVEEYLTHLANESVTIEGSEFITVAGSGTEGDPYVVSIEGGSENTMLITNEDGDLEWTTIEDIVQANETITDITDNGDGTYTYTNEEGNTFIIDVPASVVENFETIVNDGPVTINGDTFNTVEEYLTHIANESVAIEGSEFISVTGSGTDTDPYVVSIEEGAENTMLITNEDGNLEWATIEDIVQANETITDITDNGDGTYTYNNEAGDAFIIDIPASVVENFETIVNDGPVTINGDTFNTVEEYLTHLANESVAIEGSEFISVSGSGTDSDPYIVSIEEGAEKTMLITNEYGDLEWATIEDIVQANETITDITDNGDGTYTYNNEAGDAFIIDVPASVVENFETIVNDGPVTINGDTFNTVEEYLTHLANESVAIEGSEFIEVSGSGTEGDPYVVSIEGGSENTMLITNEDGDLEWATIEDIVQANETITDIIDNGDGTYTYTNEEGAEFIIDVPASVVENFETIVNDGPVTINGDTFNTVEEYLTHIANESIAIEGSEFITVSGSGTDSDPYVVSIEEGAENTMLITNEDGDLEWATIEDIVQANETITDIIDNGDGTYTYTNEEGNTFIIDVPASVVENFETIVNDGPVTINGDTFNTVEEYLTHLANESVAIEGSEFIEVSGSGTEGDPYIVSIEGGSENTMLITNEDGDLEWVTIEDIVQDNETVTFFEDEDGIYTYTNEEGDTFEINIPASVVENFETIVKNGPVIVDGVEYTTVEEYIIQIAEEGVSIEGSEFINVSGSGTEGDPYIVSIEGGSENTMLITNEEGDLEWATIEDIVQANETITDIIDNGDGTYTYTNEEGNAFIIDVPASVVENFETIVNDGPVTVNGDTFNTVEEYLTHLANESVAIEGSEFITVAGSGTDSDPYVVSIEEGDDNTMLITDDNGNVVWATIEDIVQDNETVTFFEDEDGIYTYTNEEGDTFEINIPASVVENFETIVKDGPVIVDGVEYTTVEEYIIQVAEEGVSIEGSEFISVAGSGTDTDPYVVSIEEGAENTLLITNEYGDLEWATIEDIVQDNETVTFFEDEDGIYTYTNEEGDTFEINIPASVVENFETIVKDGPVIVDGVEYTTVEEYIIQVAEEGVSIEGSEFINVTGSGTDTDPYVVSIEEGDDNTMLITNEEGDLEWTTIEEIVQGNQKTYKVIGEGMIEVEEAEDENETTYTVKSNAPDFFYMPAVIFDTSVNGTVTRDLYEEYKDQFTGQQLDIAHGVNGSSMPYTGGLVGSDGAPQAIHVYESDELYYYVTYYDEDVFENLSISADGKLTYTVKNNAEPHSYMNVVFVIKDAE